MKQEGFTLLELMIVVVIVAILAAIAIPSYQSYVRRTNEGLAIQEMQRIVILLERSKARNFSYQSFSLDPNRKIPPVYVSVLANGYIIRIADGSSTTKAADLSASSGQSWAIQAMAPSSDTQQYSLLLTSNGLRCKNKASSNVTFSTCGTGSENW